MSGFDICAYDHVGIRVTDRSRAIAFYQLLGFELEPEEEWEEHRALSMVTTSGVRINLIYNAAAQPKAHNVLLDESVRLPGITHLALVVDSLTQVMARMRELGIAITEGPLQVGRRRVICFVRDPDGNVVEFDELLLKTPSAPT
ncbi:MAG: VOC family protein [Myxococcales bacterium]|nr:VOC family protein [Myxococcales bacterium]